jgi:hypothetical protein
LTHLHRDAVPQQAVHIAVCRHRQHGGAVGGERKFGLLQRVIGKRRVQLPERYTKARWQYQFAEGLPARW